MVELRVVREGSSSWEPHATRPATLEDVSAWLREQGAIDDEREWCVAHTSNGRGPSPFGEACHYAALRMLSFPGCPIEPCEWVAALVVPVDAALRGGGLKWG